MTRISVLLVSLLAVAGVSPKAPNPNQIHSFAGPFKVIVKRLETCPPELSGRNAFRIWGTVVQTRAFPDPRFNGTIENVEPFDDGVTGNFTVANLPLSFKPKFAALPYAKYRGDFNYQQNEEKVACMRLYMDIAPIVPGQN